MNNGVLLDAKTGRPTDELKRQLERVEHEEVSDELKRALERVRHAQESADRIRQSIPIPTLAQVRAAAAKNYLDEEQQAALFDILEAENVDQRVPEHIAMNLLRGKTSMVRADVSDFSRVRVAADRVGANYTNSTTETSLHDAPTLEQFFWKPGRILHCVAIEMVSTASATPGNLTHNLRYGSATAGVIMVGTGALALATSQTTKAAMFEAWVTCRTTGATGTVIGFANYINTALSTTTLQLIPATAIATATVDTTAATAVNFTGLYSAASASNIVTVHEYALEAWN